MNKVYILTYSYIGLFYKNKIVFCLNCKCKMVTTFEVKYEYIPFDNTKLLLFFIRRCLSLKLLQSYVVNNY